MLEQTDFEGRIALLSDKHIEVLERIAMHQSSKTIARELGISQFTVDQRAKRIMQILGVQSRKEAATLFLLIENATRPAATASPEARTSIDLTGFQRTLAIFAFMLLFSVLLLALVSIAEAFSRIY